VGQGSGLPEQIEQIRDTSRSGTGTGGDSDRGSSGIGTELEADWRERLAAAGRGQEQELRRCTYGGTPFGSEAFVSETEQSSGCARNLPDLNRDANTTSPRPDESSSVAVPEAPLPSRVPGFRPRYAENCKLAYIWARGSGFGACHRSPCPDLLAGLSEQEV
jgi:hypothetical protein